MSNKKKVIEKNERKVSIMNGRKETDENMEQIQLVRISEHPIQINGNMIVLDRLEGGILRIFKPDADRPVYIQHLSGTDYVTGADLVGAIRTTIMLEEKAVLIEDIFCKEGYEELAEPMIDQVEYFSEFYDEFENVGMAEAVYQKWSLKKA